MGKISARRLTEMKEKELRKARFEIVIAMLNHDPKLCKQIRVYLK